YGNNRLPGVEAVRVLVQHLGTHEVRRHAGPNVEWTPKAYFADNANQVKVGAYRLLNFRVGYGDERAGWSGYLEARNLFDKRYIANAAIAGTATAASGLFNPGTGRAVYAGVRSRW
ncbi:MAG: TonB-dependent receptor, partial [Comamonadaceae bacterium]